MIQKMCGQKQKVSRRPFLGYHMIRSIQKNNTIHCSFPTDRSNPASKGIQPHRSRTYGFQIPSIETTKNLVKINTVCFSLFLFLFRVFLFLRCPIDALVFRFQTTSLFLLIYLFLDAKKMVFLPIFFFFHVLFFSFFVFLLSLFLAILFVFFVLFYNSPLGLSAVVVDDDDAVADVPSRFNFIMGVNVTSVIPRANPATNST